MADPTPALLIQATGQVDELDGIPCRRWLGTDAEGRRYLVFVHRIALLEDDDPLADRLTPVDPPQAWRTE